MFLLDFNLFDGSTSGQAIFEDQKEVLKLSKGGGSPLFFFAVTNTIGSMGALGAYFRENNLEHGYCTNHSLYCNVILAFKSECLYVLLIGLRCMIGFLNKPIIFERTIQKHDSFAFSN